MRVTMLELIAFGVIAYAILRRQKTEVTVLAGGTEVIHTSSDNPMPQIQKPLVDQIGQTAYGQTGHDASAYLPYYN